MLTILADAMMVAARQHDPARHRPVTARPARPRRLWRLVGWL